MAEDAYGAAMAAIEGIDSGLLRTWADYEAGLITTSEVRDGSVELLYATAEPLVAAIMAAPDPRDDFEALFRAARGAADRVEARLGGEPDQRIDRFRRWLSGLVHRADDLLHVKSEVAGWADAQPRLAPLALRSAAVATLTRGRRAGTTPDFNAEAVTTAMRALGPRLLVTLAEDFLASDPPDRAAWDQLLVALDEVACWAAATAGHGVPFEFAERACAVLLEVAGHPELTHWAVARLPVHRLSRADRAELGVLLSDRAEVMPFDWIPEADQLATATVEVAYLRTLDAVGGQEWPGQRGW